LQQVDALAELQSSIEESEHRVITVVNNGKRRYNRP